MSALAARRAAAAASAVSVASSSSNTENSRPTKATPKTSNADVKRRSGKQLSTPVKHPPSLSGPESDSDAISATVSSKRRKVETSAPGQQRYFASQNTSVPEPDTARAKGKGRVRAFSPSIPVAESASEEYDGNDSSAVGSEVEIDEEEDAAVLVDEGRFRWATSGASTPLPSRSYQATAASQKVVDDGGNTRSKFTPKVGVNQYSVSEAMLRSIGLDGDGPGVVVSLAEGENLMITGIYTILPIQGIVSIFSTQISPSSTSKPIEVYATTSHPIPIIEPATSPSDVPIQSPFLQQLHLPWSYLIGSEQTICLIRENKCGLETIRAGAVPGFTNMLPEGSDNWGLKNFKPVFDSFPMLTYPYATSLSWSHSLNSLRHARNVDEQAYRPPTVVLVKGPKRSGKSTLARAALNTLLERYERVAWLECDLGQGEFTCGGAVGLWVLDSPVLGPSFTHPRIPHRAHFLGAYTPLACPDEYIAAIRHLTTEYTYNVQYPSVDLSASGMLYPSSQSDKITDVVPLVINTQGWVKGLGEDLLRGIEHASQPTHIFDFEQPVPEGIVEQSMNGWTSSPPHQSARLPNSLGYEMAGTESYLATSTDMGLREVKTFKVEPAPVSPLQARYTASDMRSLSTITYFHSRISSSAESQPRLTTWDLSRPLACERPLEVDLCADGPLRQVYIIGEGSNGVTKQDLVLSLNGSIVALVQIGDVRREEVYVQGRASPDLDKINLLGYAVIRAIRPHPSIEDGFQLQLLTPLRDAALGRCNAIIKNGAMELPLSTLLDWRKQPGDSSEEGVFGRRWEDGVPFLASGEAHGVGVERRRIRRNIMRKGM